MIFLTKCNDFSTLFFSVFSVCFFSVLYVRCVFVSIIDNIKLVMIRTIIYWKKNKELITSELTITINSLKIQALTILHFKSTLISTFLSTIDTLLRIDETIQFVFRLLFHTHHSIRFLRFQHLAYYPRILKC